MTRMLLIIALLCCSYSLAEPATATILPSRWLDEGVTDMSEVVTWGHQQRFCFYENASLHIRMDPLNSTLQPALIQSLGQSREANALFNMTNATLWYLQRVAWPLRPVFWTWTELRVVVKSPKVHLLSFTYTRTPRMLCRSVLKAVQLTLTLENYVPPFVVQVVEKLVFVMSKLLCENCVNGCPLKCRELEDGGTCMLELSPYHAPCITVTGPLQPFISTVTPHFFYDFTFYTYLTWMYAQNFFLGLLLFYSSEWLSRSRSFHYLLGATVGVLFSALLALYLFQRQARNSTKFLPGAQIVSSLLSMATVAVPITSFVIMPNLYRLGTWAISYLVYLWNREVLFGIPHLGKIYFAFFAIFGCVLVWWYQWGASAKVDTIAQDEEDNGEIDNLDEELPPPTNSQLIISRSLKLVGMTLLFYSTSSTETSLLLILLVSLTRVFEIIATIAYFWYHFEKPGRHSNLITKSQYEKQGQFETEKALAQLQEHLKQHPEKLDLVREENEIRLRRFTRGRNHLDVATQESMLSRQPKQRRSFWSYCSIQ
ncbi:putative NEMP family protein [Plasmopara halstedii]